MYVSVCLFCTVYEMREIVLFILGSNAYIRILVETKSIRVH